MAFDELPVIRFHIENNMVSDLTVVPAKKLETSDLVFLNQKISFARHYLDKLEYSSLSTVLDEIISRNIVPFISELHDYFERQYLKTFGLDTAHKIIEETAKAGFFSTAGLQSGVTLEELTASKDINNRNQMNSVFINAMPRSASTFISELFRQHYEGPTKYFKIGFPEYPSNRLLPSKVRFLSGGGVFCKDHFMATPENLDVLRRSEISKIFVMIRDPRQALLSWAHECANQVCLETTAIREFDYINAEEFCKADLPKRIDLLIDNYYPALVLFADQWVKLSETDEEARISVKIGEYMGVKENCLQYFERIAKFFDLPTEIIETWRKVEGFTINQGSKLMFRKGEINEWKEVFSPEQIAKTTEMIPEYLIQKFGWLKI